MMNGSRATRSAQRCQMRNRRVAATTPRGASRSAAQGGDAGAHGADYGHRAGYGWRRDSAAGIGARRARIRHAFFRRIHPDRWASLRSVGDAACSSPTRREFVHARERTNWSGRRDSNPRPQPWQGCALPLSYTRILFRQPLSGGSPMPNDSWLCNSFGKIVRNWVTAAAAAPQMRQCTLVSLHPNVTPLP
jgi:hypothetical protein